MLDEHKNIAIILTEKAHQPSLGTIELQTWLDEQIEIGLIAQAKAFVFSGPTESKNQWKTLADLIAEQRENFDGFIVVDQLDSLLTTSAAVSFMIHGLNKPLIFTASTKPTIFSKTLELTNDFGIRANLLNSLQVAILNLQQPAIVFGNRIIKSTRALRTHESTINLFQSFQAPLLGSIDFGVHLQDSFPQTTADFSLHTSFESKVFVLDVFPGMSNGTVPEESVGIVSRSPLSADWIDQFSKGRPVLIVGNYPLQHPSVIQIDSMTWEVAVIKFGWALEQTHDIAELRALMTKNITGELGV